MTSINIYLNTYFINKQFKFKNFFIINQIIISFIYLFYKLYCPINIILLKLLTNL